MKNIIPSITAALALSSCVGSVQINNYGTPAVRARTHHIQERAMGIVGSTHCHDTYESRLPRGHHSHPGHHGVQIGVLY